MASMCLRRESLTLRHVSEWKEEYKQIYNYNRMKKYLYSLMVVMFVAFSLSLSACGDDDDDEPNENVGGKVTFSYEGATTQSYSIEEATWRAFSQTVVGTGHYDLDKGATFSARFGDENSRNANYLQFQTKEPVVQGMKLVVDDEALFFGVGSVELRSQEVSGEVNVKTVSGNKIVLQFKNFTFLREINSAGKTQRVTVNGTISYTNED